MYHSEVPIIGDKVDPNSLVKKAEGLNRAEIMKSVVGPYLFELFSNAQQEQFSDQEKEKIPVIHTFDPDVNYFMSMLDLFMQQRTNFSDIQSDTNHPIKKLFLANSSLFSEFVGSDVISSAIQSGFTIPFTVATQIYRVEKDIPFGSKDTMKFVQFDYPKMIEIMSRGSFDDMMQTLTKGPPGYLGFDSIKFRMGTNKFFDFVSTDGQQLGPSDVFLINQNGQVVGFNDTFQIAANQRRKEANRIQEEHLQDDDVDRSSSGCPVRHTFKNEHTGEVQESLIFTNTDFIVRALQQSEQNMKRRGKLSISRRHF
ncbi:MAG: hypothetical protein Q7T74_04400 [Candidatus Saccharibacteria bacterium]|nr:hypothetical protein [Candidatus Saccharibacteria bacterium]